MSKQAEADSDRIPTYEESIAASPLPQPSTSPEKTSPRQTIKQRTDQERTHRITALITNHFEPAINNHLEDGITKFVIIILPTDAFPTDSTENICVASITSPPLTLPTTLLNLRSSLTKPEREEDYTSSSLIQGPVIHDLTYTLQHALLNPLTISTDPHQPPLQSTTILTPISSPLPQRTLPKSWLHRNIAKVSMPPASHDPTGTTGAWNLGWRSNEDPVSTRASVCTGGVSIHTRLQDVSFRVENEMGLWESLCVRGVWVEVEMEVGS